MLFSPLGYYRFMQGISEDLNFTQEGKLYSEFTGAVMDIVKYAVPTIILGKIVYNYLSN